MMEQTSQIKQPVQEGPAKLCKKACKVDQTRQYCVGCLRTIQEIIEYGRRHAKETTKTS